MKSWHVVVVVCTFTVCATACFLFGKKEGGIGLAVIGSAALALLPLTTKD